MANTMRSVLIALTMVLSLSSCFTYSYTVGEGPQTGVEIKSKNHYMILGLAVIDSSDPIEMAGGAENYQVTVKHTFLDGLINGITCGFYNPTTTIVTK